MFKIGDEIIWVGELTGRAEMRAGRITKIRENKDMPLVWVDNLHAPEDCIYMAYCWPARVRTELTAILAERARLQKLADDSMKLVYELKNAIGRGEK
jgi:hypothetical protein